jgi:hypothetical protein
MTAMATREDVQSVFVRFDSSTRTTAELALSIDLEGVALQRVRLPPSKTGLLLRQRGGLDAFLPHAAFWGGAARALPSFANIYSSRIRKKGERWRGRGYPRAH